MDYSGSYAVGRADLGVALMEYDAQNADAYIAERVFPTVDVAKDAAKFSRVPRAVTMQLVDNKIGPGGNYNRVDDKAKDDSYTTQDYGLEGKIRDRDREKFVSDFDCELVKAKTVSNAMKIARETRVKAKLFDTSTWTGSDLTTDVSGTPWNTTSSDIPSHVAAAKEKVRRQTGIEPNKLVVGKAAFEYMKLNDKILAKIATTKDKSPQEVAKLIAILLGLEEIVVGGGVYDAGGEGASAATVTDIWGSTYASLAIVCPPGSSMEQLCVGRTFNWTPFAAIGKVTMYREEPVRSDILRIEESTDEKVIEKYAAHLLKIN